MPEIRVERHEILDPRKRQFIDQIVPTLTLMRASRVRGTGVTVTAGSHRVAPGSVFQMTYLSIQAGSAELWWALTKTGTLAPGQINGTVDIGYLQGRGVENRSGKVDEPVHSLGPGTFQLRLLQLGSARWAGVAFEGVEL
ncbi:MAG: hypothetical protein ABSF24_06685 [Candidatus Bathyarchaeia archaeon]